MSKFLLNAALLALIGGTFSEKLLLCYYGSWATYRNGNGACHVQDLDPFVCSHLIYTFVGLNDDASIRIMDPWLELPDNWGRDNFGQFNKLKTINPKLKTIVAIGGWNEGSARYSKVANNATLRAAFAKNAAEFTVQYGFDGFDLDWEYPGQRDSAAGSADISAHALLLQVMREAFDKAGLLLTAAVASVKSSAQLSYDIPALGKYLDFIHVMTYDLHGAWDQTTGHNANLRQYETDVAAADSYDVATAINYWLDNGAPKEKLIMGLPLYGRTFSLTNQADTSVGADSSGPGIAGQYSYENGMVGLNELCEKQLTQSWPEKWDTTAQVPYTSSGKDWISYDNHESLALKVEFAMSKELAGVMVWSIETDDFKGICHSEKFAYLNTINKAIGRTVESATTAAPGFTTTTTTTQAPTADTATTTKATTAATTITTTGSPNSSTTDSNSICTKEGYVRDPSNCAIFYQCVWMSSSWEAYKFICATPLLFDADLHICNYPAFVTC